MQLNVVKNFALRSFCLASIAALAARDQYVARCDQTVCSLSNKRHVIPLSDLATKVINAPICPGGKRSPHYTAIENGKAAQALGAHKSSKHLCRCCRD